MSSQTRILCVDDERNVLRSLERIFWDDDYLIMTAGSGEEGLRLLAEAPQVQVVISDFRMPGMNGVEFLKEVYRRHPDTLRIVLSGYADTAAVVAAINEGKIYKFIPKPWNDDELRMTVAKALEHFAAQHRSLRLAEELGRKNEELAALNAHLEQMVQERTAELRRQNLSLNYANLVLDQLPVGVVGLSPRGLVTQLNREAAELLAVEREPALGEPMSGVLPREFCALAESIIDSAPGGRTVELLGREFQVCWITLQSEDQSGSVVTIIKPLGT